MPTDHSEQALTKARNAIEQNNAVELIEILAAHPDLLSNTETRLTWTQNGKETYIDRITLLTYSIAIARPAITKLLVRLGCNLEQKNSAGQTAYEFGRELYEKRLVRSSAIQPVEPLVEQLRRFSKHRFQSNFKCRPALFQSNALLYTPLDRNSNNFFMVCCQYGVDVDIRYFLFWHPIDLNLRNNKGETAFDLAKKNHDRGILKTLQQAAKLLQALHKQLNPLTEQVSTRLAEIADGEEDSSIAKQLQSHWEILAEQAKQKDNAIELQECLGLAKALLKGLDTTTDLKPMLLELIKERETGILDTALDYWIRPQSLANQFFTGLVRDSIHELNPEAENHWDILLAQTLSAGDGWEDTMLEEHLPDTPHFIRTSKLGLTTLQDCLNDLRNRLVTEHERSTDIAVRSLENREQLHTQFHGDLKTFVLLHAPTYQNALSLISDYQVAKEKADAAGDIDLYALLINLCNDLFRNSVAGENRYKPSIHSQGINDPSGPNDAHTRAGEGIYPKLKHFFEQWNQLPKEVREEVEALGADPEGRVGPCIGDILAILKSDKQRVKTNIGFCINTKYHNLKAILDSKHIKKRLAELSPGCLKTQSAILLRASELAVKQLAEVDTTNLPSVSYQPNRCFIAAETFNYLFAFCEEEGFSETFKYWLAEINIHARKTKLPRKFATQVVIPFLLDDSIPDEVIFQAIRLIPDYIHDKTISHQLLLKLANKNKTHVASHLLTAGASCNALLDAGHYQLVASFIERHLFPKTKKAHRPPQQLTLISNLIKDLKEHFLKDKEPAVSTSPEASLALQKITILIKNLLEQLNKIQLPETALANHTDEGATTTPTRPRAGGGAGEGAGARPSNDISESAETIKDTMQIALSLEEKMMLVRVKKELKELSKKLQPILERLVHATLPKLLELTDADAFFSLVDKGDFFSSDIDSIQSSTDTSIQEMEIKSLEQWLKILAETPSSDASDTLYKRLAANLLHHVLQKAARFYRKLKAVDNARIIAMIANPTPSSLALAAILDSLSGAPPIIWAMIPLGTPTLIEFRRKYRDNIQAIKDLFQSHVRYFPNELQEKINRLYKKYEEKLTQLFSLRENQIDLRSMALQIIQVINYSEMRHPAVSDTELRKVLSRITEEVSSKVQTDIRPIARKLEIKVDCSQLIEPLKSRLQTTVNSLRQREKQALRTSILACQPGFFGGEQIHLADGSRIKVTSTAFEAMKLFQYAELPPIELYALLAQLFDKALSKNGSTSKSNKARYKSIKEAAEEHCAHPLQIL
jgi:hypothetical protein